MDNVHLQSVFQLLGVDVYKEKHYRTQLLDELYSEVKQATFKELRKLAKDGFVLVSGGWKNKFAGRGSPLINFLVLKPYGGLLFLRVVDVSGKRKDAGAIKELHMEVLQDLCKDLGLASVECHGVIMDNTAANHSAMRMMQRPQPGMAVYARAVWVLMVWNALVDHAKEWVEHAVIVSPRLALGVVAAFQRRAQTHYSPAYAAAYALDPANYKHLAPGTHPRPTMHRLQPTQQEDVVTVVARLAECSLGAARRELTLLTLGDWPTDMKSSVEAIVAETRTDKDGKTTTACITAERNWSSWGNTYNAGRSQLNVATAEKMVFIKANIPSSEPSEPSQLMAEGITI
ncbi:hypothetical protein QJQ45_008563 [Haematococcus lacustris]|nr:hypothetical protein QJQ45_008563 [Haematococcus lacustris]